MDAALRVQVFAKAPVAGNVKTRLVPPLTTLEAVALYQKLVHHSVQVAVEAKLGDVELWCAPDTSDIFFQELATLYPLRLRQQMGADLGQRMTHALDHANHAGAASILIGTDCAVISPAYLQAAAAALHRYEVVLGPAEDGGYVLVARSRADIDCFSAMPWSTCDVIERTRERLTALGIRWHELSTLWDVDTSEDLLRLRELPAFSYLNSLPQFVAIQA